MSLFVNTTVLVFCLWR